MHSRFGESKLVSVHELNFLARRVHNVFVDRYACLDYY